MGTGVNDFVLGLGDWMGQLYVGGSFTRARGTTSFGIARWATFEALVPVEVVSMAPARNRDGSATVTWEVTDVREHAGFHVHRETDSGDRIRLTPDLLLGDHRYAFTDANFPAGPAAYWLEAVSRAGETAWFGPVRLSAAAAPVLVLRGARPNPFHDAARIDFALPVPGRARVTVFDVRGRTVATLLDATLPAGDHSLTWNGTRGSGERVTPGLYFIRLVQGDRQVSGRVLLRP